MTPILELRGITRQFPAILANDHIDLTLEQGEILALLGENGAGKTTLMNILYGLYQPDEGEIFVKGTRLEVHQPSDAIHAGIGMVHQHFMLVPVFTVAENVVLGQELMRPAARPKRATSCSRSCARWWRRGNRSSSSPTSCAKFSKWPTALPSCAAAPSSAPPPRPKPLAPNWPR